MEGEETRCRMACSEMIFTFDKMNRRQNKNTHRDFSTPNLSKMSAGKVTKALFERSLFRYIIERGNISSKTEVAVGKKQNGRKLATYRLSRSTRESKIPGGKFSRALFEIFLIAPPHPDKDTKSRWNEQSVLPFSSTSLAI